MADAQERIREWMDAAAAYALPDWEQMPAIPLYMDQILMLTRDALSPFVRDEKQSLLTSSMINNYVKSGVVEHPVHKKYTREQLAKLIVTSMLKQVLSIQDIAVLLSGDAEAAALYKAFAAAQDTALHETVQQLEAVEGPEALRAEALRLLAEANARRAAAERILAELSAEQRKEKGKTKPHS